MLNYSKTLHVVNIKYFEILIFIHTYLNNSVEAEKTVSEALSYIEDFKFCRIRDKHAILVDSTAFYIKKRDFINAYSLILKCKDLWTKKKNIYNYFAIYGLEYMVISYQKIYNDLLSVVAQVFRDDEIKKYKELYQSWKIREAYCKLLILAGKITQETVEKHPIKPLRINKFINDTEFFAKDKRGLNISILLVPLIYYLIKKQYGKIQNKVDSLKQYSFKYLRKDETLRSNCFIKMILKLPEADYHPARTARYVAKYKKILIENPAELSSNRTDTEIIPYEDLWEIIEEVMERNMSK